jgi:hypothetical protein
VVVAAVSARTVAAAAVAAAGDDESGCFVCWKETKALLCRDRERIKDEDEKSKKQRE